VAIIVVLLEQPAREFSLPQQAVSELARLGITNAALVRDEQTAGVVLEGWLFDPLASARAVADAISPEHATRTLHPVMQLAIPTQANTTEEHLAHRHS
jgi:hypothetical protein